MEVNVVDAELFTNLHVNSVETFTLEEPKPQKR